MIDIDYDTPDRVDLAKFLKWEEDLNSYDVFESEFLQKMLDVPPEGIYQVSHEINAADLIAKNIFGKENYWWILMWYNGLLALSDLQPTKKLATILPSELQRLYFNLHHNAKG